MYIVLEPYRSHDGESSRSYFISLVPLILPSLTSVPPRGTRRALLSDKHCPSFNVGDVSCVGGSQAPLRILRGNLLQPVGPSPGDLKATVLIQALEVSAVEELPRPSNETVTAVLPPQVLIGRLA